MPEHAAVNRRVVGSSPTWGASRKPRNCAVFSMSESLKNAYPLASLSATCSELFLNSRTFPFTAVEKAYIKTSYFDFIIKICWSFFISKTFVQYIAVHPKGWAVNLI